LLGEICNMPGLGALFTSIEIDDADVLPGEDNVQVREKVQLTPAGSTLPGRAKNTVRFTRPEELEIVG
jgi:hypothetical protein